MALSKGKIYKYDLQGNFVNEYESVEAAAYLDKIAGSYLSQHLKGVSSFCNKHIYTRKYYIKLPNELLENKTRRIYKTKQVHQYSLDGKHIKSYNSCQDAAMETGFKYRYIMNFLSGNLNKRSKTYKGFFWSYEKKDELQKFERKLCFKEIHQYSMNGNYIKTYNSLKEAGEKLNIRPAGISSCVNGQIKSYKGFIWSLIKLKKVKSVNPKKKSINVYKYNKLYKTFESATDASKKLNICRSGITGCLNGRSESTKGYTFKYKNIN
jgi:hypothetical protein